MVNGFCFGWWDVADRPQQAFVVEPVDPIERGQFDRFQVPPRATVDHLRLVQSVDRLGQGVIRGRTVKTTVSDKATPCPLDKVNRQFKADRPNQLWVSDFTYVSTWQGWLYVAFVIDVFARRIVGWRVSSSMRTDFVLDALEQALYARQPERDHSLIHHSDRGSQYVSIPVSYTHLTLPTSDLV